MVENLLITLNEQNNEYQHRTTYIYYGDICNYPKCWDTLTPYHKCPKIWTSPFNYLLVSQTTNELSDSVDPDQTRVCNVSSCIFVPIIRVITVQCLPYVFWPIDLSKQCRPTLERHHTTRRRCLNTVYTVYQASSSFNTHQQIVK